MEHYRLRFGECLRNGIGWDAVNNEFYWILNVYLKAGKLLSRFGLKWKKKPVGDPLNLAK